MQTCVLGRYVSASENRSIFGTGTFNHTQEDFMDIIKGDRRQIIISTHVIVSWLVTSDIQLGHSRGPGFLFL